MSRILDIPHIPRVSCLLRCAGVVPIHAHSQVQLAWSYHDTARLGPDSSSHFGDVHWIAFGHLLLFRHGRTLMHEAIWKKVRGPHRATVASPRCVAIDAHLCGRRAPGDRPGTAHDAHSSIKLTSHRLVDTSTGWWVLCTSTPTLPTPALTRIFALTTNFFRCITR